MATIRVNTKPLPNPITSSMEIDPYSKEFREAQKRAAAKTAEDMDKYTVDKSA